MTTSRFLALFLLAGWLCTSVMARMPAAGTESFFTVAHIDAQLVIKRSVDLSNSDLLALLSAFDATLTASLDDAALALVTINDDASLQAAAELAMLDSRVLYAEPNFLYAPDATPNDTDFAQQWSKNNDGFNAPNGLGTAGADLNLVSAWDTRTTANDVIVALIDDSFETGHLDLAANFMSSGKCFASASSSRPCSNGANDPRPTSAADFHGTLVAGAAGARGNNLLGIAGAAWETRLLPLKVDLSLFAIVQAVDEAILQGAAIINMSFGGPAPSSAFSEAIDRAESAGVLVVASAGNADCNNDRCTVYPANYTQPNVLSVAATNASDFASSFSQWASIGVDLAAPGEGILTTSDSNSYARASGTSFSAPHVAGVAALIKSHSGSSDYRQVKAHLLYGGTDGSATLGPVVPGQDKRQIPGRSATGRLDAARALTGTTAAVLVVDAISIDDVLGGNGNGFLEPGETALLRIGLRNHWTAASGVSASLTSSDGALLQINDMTPQVYGSIPANGTATADYSVTLDSGATGNRQVLLTLDISSAAPVTYPARHFYLETGALVNGETTTQDIQRWNWDEFQAFQFSVPVGASQLTVNTSGSGDIDLLMRYDSAPRYLITPNSAAGSGFYYTDADTRVSALDGASENITVSNPLPGTYHIVVVNFDQSAKSYAITATHDATVSDTLAFTSDSFAGSEQDGQVVISVQRTGNGASASVDYATSDGSAIAGDDYVAATGTLSWATGESGVKSFTVALGNDTQAENAETFSVILNNAMGATTGSPSTTTVTINDDDAASSNVSFDETELTVSETVASVNLTVNRSMDTSEMASIDYQTRDGSARAGTDYTATSGTLTWDAGDAMAKTITVSLLDDSSEENTETFEVVLLNPVNTLVGTEGVAVVSITSEDAPVAAPAASGGGGGSTGWLSLALLVMLGCRRSKIQESYK